ncbi:methylcytosine dioxygenase TET2 [Pangasianodon hypophthalmus]|uniref:methylcytosine dioxygenase TET2 n=1 Tax=Pangasianodon hypophthalmus TaxID=310915 RepID=UPI002308226E|nr:methylcytosine dioxygenase TET2 [Pangasianodon hypophthalmus]
METEQARHETEESLIHTQLSATHQVPAKLQNGNQSPDTSPQPLNGDTIWSNFKQMKRHRDDCSSPVTMYDQGLYKINGEVKHALNEQSLVALHQPKKLCVNSETTGPWEKKETDKEGCLDTIPELSKPVPDTGNCNYPNGDIFSLSSNKQMPMPNGATVTPPSVEGPAGDLLEKTQSQYYPNHVSITQDTSNLHEQAISSPSVTSGFPISAQMPASEPLATTQSEVHGSNGYDPEFMVNGYSGNFGAEQQHQPYPLADLPALENQPQSDLGKGPGIASTVSISDGSQSQNGRECFASNPVGLSIFSKSSQDFSQESYPMPVQADVAGTFGSFKNSATDHKPSTVTGQQHLQYGMQQNQSNVSCSADGSPQGNGVSAPPPVEIQAAPINQCNELEHKPPVPDQGGNVGSDTQMGWINLNSTPTSQHHANQAHMWKSFSPNENTARQSQGDLLNPDTSHSFQMQPGFPQQQEGHMQNGYNLPAQPHPNAATECQPGTPKIPSDMHSQPNMQLSNAQPQQHANEQFFRPVQQEQLCKNDQNLGQVLPPDFVHRQPSQPHQQYEAHQQQASTIMHHDAQGPKMVPQLQNPSQGQVNSQLPNRRTVEGYTQAEISSPTFRQPNLTGKVQNGSNPSSQPTLPFPDQPRPNSQPSPNDMASMFGFGGAAEMQKQPQRQYTLSAQHSQQIVKHMLPRNVDFQHSQHARLQHQLPDGTHSRQMPAQMFPKAESQDSCFQFQRGPLSSPGSQGDFQRHAALRMHLLQKQERPSCPQSPDMIRPDLRLVKRENDPRFEAPIRMPPPQMQHQNRDLTGSMLATVKQERTSSTCSQSQNRSILATMEQQLQQYQPSPVFERRSLAIKSPNKVKVEMAGSVAVISTNIEGSSEDQKPPASTPKKEPGLQCFLDSPMKLLDTPIKNLLDTPIKTQYEFPPCHCVEQISEKDEGPYYTHLGAAPNIKSIREMMEKRSGLTGGAIRIEKVVYTGKEGKSTQGCPIAKWVIRRANEDEKLLVLVRERGGHSCETSCIVVVIVIWEGIPASLADRLYVELSDTLTKHGAMTNRRCALNEERTCACQGRDPDACGASFSFGCSWSMYYNGCKFARSKIPRKFKLLGDDPKEEEKLERNLQALASFMAPVYKKMAPEAYSNQVEHEHRAPDCRLGLKDGRPFSGVTACLDFCAHAHRDLHNMPGGSTVVCTLTREDNREIGKIPDDEQLHVLPLYKAASTDEFGSAEAQLEKTRTGAIQVLSTFRRQVRMLAEPAKSCRQRKLEGKKGGANKPSHLSTPSSKADSTQQAKQQKQSSCDNVGQHTPVAGAHLTHMGAPLLPGQNPLAAQNQPQQQNQQSQPSTPLPFSSPISSANYARYPNTAGSFPSTSKPPNMFPQSPSSASPYHSPLPVPSSYMNGSNPPSPYPGALAPNNLYPGYQCNGSIPMDNYHPYYSNPKHLDVYRQQRPSLYPDQQFNPQQRYGMNYPPRYGEPGLTVNGYGNCNMRPNMHPMGHYPGYSSNGGPNAQFLDAISRPPLSHPSLDYAAANKSIQFGRYPNPYLAQNHHFFPQNIDPLSMQKPEMSLHGTNGFPQVLPSVGREGMNPSQPPGMSLPNGNIQPSMVKQEQGITMPAPQEEEDAWSDNEHNFLDPEIGGVAVAPSHGSILIECAKRELHATTPLKKPDRTHPTRISLVFYQHKNLNEAKHGLALWEAKMAEKAREKEEDAEKHGTDGTPSKSGGKRVKKEHPEPSEPSEPPYKRFVQMLAEKSLSCTTNTYVSSAPYAFTKVTGPYSHFL